MFKKIQYILDYLGFSNYSEKSMSDVKRLFFLTLALFPLLQYLSIEYLHRAFDLLFGFLGTALLLVYIINGTKIVFPKYILIYIIIAVYYLGWDIANNKMGTLSSGVLTYIYSAVNIHVISILLLIENTKFDKRFIDSVLLIFKITIVIAFIVSVIQFTVNPFFFTPKELVAEYFNRGFFDIRRTSIFGYISPNEVGKSLIAIVAIMIGYSLKIKKPVNVIWLILAGVVFFTTNSRWVYLNFMIILLQYPIVNGINTKKVLLYALIAVMALSAIYISLRALNYDINAYIKGRLLSESAETRFIALKAFAEYFPKNPFFGSGVHVGEDLRRVIFGRTSQIHIGYLSHLYEFGLIGSFFLFSAWFLITRYFYRTAKQSGYYGSLFAFIAFLAGNLTLVIYSIYCYGLLYAFIFNKYINDKEFSKQT